MAPDRTITIKPFKNWVSVFFLSLFFIAILICIGFQTALIIATKAYPFFLYTLLTALLGFFVFKQLSWLFSGKHEIVISGSELTIRKVSWLFASEKRYFIAEISEVSCVDFFGLQWIKIFPLGRFHSDLMGAFIKDKKSILIRYQGKQIPILQQLTEAQSKDILNILQL